ncbi:MAG: GNAT family N-acetyltransferase [Bacteroidia bacterium]
MIKFIEHKNIDKQKWDACIQSSSSECIFVYSWYLDIVSDNWAALVLNDYEAVFPIASKSKYKINYIYQPFFTRYFGLYSKNKISEKLINEFLTAIPEKYKYIEFCLHEDNHIKNKNFEVSEKKYQLLNLNEKYETLQKQFSDNSKRNIKKALKAGLTIKENIAPEKIVNLFKITKGNELEVFKDEDYKVLIKLMNTCLKKDKGRSFAIYEGEKLCAAAFFMITNDRFVFLKSGITDEGKAKGAMHLMFDYFIRENSGKPYMLDFGGSSVENVARFYKNFNAKDCVYLQLRKNNLSKLVTWIKSLKS